MHGADLYDEIVRVPLILSAPGRVEPAVVPWQVSLVDLMPTLLELADAPIDGLDGTSLLPLADGSEHGDRPAFIVGTDKGAVSQLALRQPPWKLTVQVQSGEEQAYRLDDDPGELVDRVEEGLRRASRAPVRGARDRLAARAQRGGAGARRAAPVRSGLSIGRVRSRESWQANPRR